MKRYELNFIKEEVPKYLQIEQHIRKQIEEGQIADGERLPSIRELAERLQVNNVTVVNAYKRLQQEGYAIQKMGSGTFAKRKEFSPSFRKDYSELLKKLGEGAIREFIDFAGETSVSDVFPVKTFQGVLNEVLERDGVEAFAHQEALGYNGLRSSINKYFWSNELDEEGILIVTGAQQGIDIVSKVLVHINDNVIVERPTYSGALSVFKARRANILEVDMEDDGIDITSFEKILKKHRIKCFYTMSYFQNPTGATYRNEKKKQILNLAEKYDFFIIEDDYLSELIFNPKIEYQTFKSLDPYDRVIYIKSFSKIFLPGIRIGYLISPEILKEPIQNAKINTDIATSSLMQRALDVYIRRNYWKEHILYLNEYYRDRYVRMRDALHQILSSKVSYLDPGGGLSFFLKLSSKIKMTSTELFYQCKERKVLITPGVLFYKYPQEGERYIRVSFAQTTNEQMIDGLQIMNHILQESQ